MPTSRLLCNLALCSLFAACGDPSSAATDGGDGSTTSNGPSSTNTDPGGSTPASSSGRQSSSGPDDSTSTSGSQEPLQWPKLTCDPLVPTYCGYPFPNNVFTVEDETAPSGRRLALAIDAMPQTRDGTQGAPDAFNDRDGFSPGSTILAHLPGAVATGLPDPLHIADSLGPDSPTVLLDVTTAERVPHFAEIDVRVNADEASLMIQPATSLAYTHRYVVAVREVVDADGTRIAASEAFAALRDDVPSDEASVDERRALYADILGHLQDAGIERSSLQLAWDFTVASREDTNDRLLSMRDQALAAVGSGPSYEILSVDEDVSEHIFRRVRGELEVPLFLDDPGPGGVMQLDGDGVPMQNGVARYPFTIMVPYSAQTTPAPGVMFGHGLFGSRSEVESSAFQQFANDANLMLIAMDWIGMSSEDPALVGLIVSNGNLSEFRTLPDRLQQALLNYLLATRMMRTSIVDDDALRFEDASMLDPENSYYYGGSQGGIMGASYMAVATDARRGVLAVPGQPYNLLLERSVNFDAFADIIISTYARGFDGQMLLALVQLLWDRAEPSGYAVHVADDTLPGTPAHDVLLLASIGDHQVSTLGAHVMARSIGVPNVSPTNRAIWGLEERQAPFSGSALIEHDFGLPPEPLVNEPMREGDDPHGALAGVPSAAQTVATFLHTGQVQSFCAGVCDPD